MFFTSIFITIQRDTVIKKLLKSCAIAFLCSTGHIAYGATTNTTNPHDKTQSVVAQLNAEPMNDSKSISGVDLETNKQVEEKKAAEADPNSNAILRKYPIYIGAIVGWGNTNWQQMVSQDDVTSTSTPTSAGGTGLAYGAVLGYEFEPYFALEANYMRFPDSNIELATPSVYSPITGFVSRTREASIVGKFLVPVYHTGIRAFADVGPAYVHRKDVLADKGKLGGTFGVGMDYNLTQHFMTELSFQYYTGYGESELKPVLDYIPFLYTVNVRVAYRFNI